MHRGRLPACCCRHVRVDGLQRPSGRNASPSGNNTHPINHHVAGRGANPRSWTEISLGARAYPTNLNNLKPLGRLDKDRPAQISHIVKYSRGTATHVHGPEPCKLGTPERAVDDRHEVDITPARAKRSILAEPTT